MTYIVSSGALDSTPTNQPAAGYSAICSFTRAAAMLRHSSTVTSLLLWQWGVIFAISSSIILHFTSSAKVWQWCILSAVVAVPHDGHSPTDTAFCLLAKSGLFLKIGLIFMQANWYLIKSIYLFPDSWTLTTSHSKTTVLPVIASSSQLRIQSILFGMQHVYQVLYLIVIIVSMYFKRTLVCSRVAWRCDELTWW